MTKLEVHRCDRCDDKVYVPDQSIYPYKDPDLLDDEDTEICGLCHEALKYAYWGLPIPEGLEGVVKHEEKFRAEAAAQYAEIEKS